MTERSSAWHSDFRPAIALPELALVTIHSDIINTHVNLFSTFTCEKSDIVIQSVTDTAFSDRDTTEPLSSFQWPSDKTLQSL